MAGWMIDNWVQYQEALNGDVLTNFKILIRIYYQGTCKYSFAEADLGAA